MKFKNIKILAIIIIFILSFPIHFLYDILPNPIFAIFFPVNESIFEHLKILFTSVLLYGIIDYILLKKNNFNTDNFILNLFVSAFPSILIFLILWLPIYFIIGENFIITMVILFITYIISQIISYYILSINKHYKILNILSFILIIITYILFAYFTYNPLKNHFFLDTKDEKYGINIYNI